MLFEPWYAANYSRLVAGLTVVSGDPDVADDAVAEAMLRALANWGRLEQMERPEAWVFKVALNIVRRRARRLALERALLRRPESFAPSYVPIEVWDAVRSLPPRQRQAVALRYLVGLSEAEVARTMGIAVGTASATLASARSRLAHLIGNETQSEVQRT